VITEGDWRVIHWSLPRAELELAFFILQVVHRVAEYDQLRIGVSCQDLHQQYQTVFNVAIPSP